MKFAQFKIVSQDLMVQAATNKDIYIESISICNTDASEIQVSVYKKNTGAAGDYYLLNGITLYPKSTLIYNILRIQPSWEVHVVVPVGTADITIATSN